MARPLKIFMRGKSITLLQEVLRRLGYVIEDQRGLFGTMTRDAVKSFQKQRDLKPTGIVDDALMQQMTHGQTFVQPAAQIAVENKDVSVDQRQWHALVHLLVSKGVIEAGELEAMMDKVKPTGL